MSRVCRNIRNSAKSQCHKLEHGSKIWLLKTHSHTSERLGYEARNNEKKRRKRRHYNKANHRRKPPAYRQRDEGGRDEKGVMIRPTIVKNLPRTASKAWGGRDEEKRNEGELRRYDKGNQRQNPPTARHRGEGRDERRNQTKL